MAWRASTEAQVYSWVYCWQARALLVKVWRTFPSGVLAIDPPGVLSPDTLTAICRGRPEQAGAGRGKQGQAARRRQRRPSEARILHSHTDRIGSWIRIAIRECPVFTGLPGRASDRARVGRDLGRNGSEPAADCEQRGHSCGGHSTGYLLVA